MTWKLAHITTWKLAHITTWKLGPVMTRILTHTLIRKLARIVSWKQGQNDMETANQCDAEPVIHTHWHEKKWHKHWQINNIYIYIYWDTKTDTKRDTETHLIKHSVTWQLAHTVTLYLTCVSVIYQNRHTRKQTFTITVQCLLNWKMHTCRFNNI